MKGRREIKIREMLRVNNMVMVDFKEVFLRKQEIWHGLVMGVKNKKKKLRKLRDF